jgi:hypothetical protein
MMIAQGDYTISIGGGQPNTEAPVALGSFMLMGSTHCLSSGFAQCGVRRQQPVPVELPII